jgi:hypothetical protein
MNITPDKPLAAIIDNSREFCQIHTSGLSRLGIDSVAFYSSSGFEIFIEGPNYNRRFDLVLTDGLDGNYESVVHAAQEHGISVVWVISGSEAITTRAKKNLGVNTANKTNLSDNSQVYEDILKSISL